MATLSLDFFETLVFSGKCGMPPPEVIASLEALSGLVGSPNYSRTPNFKRPTFENRRWDNFRTFVKTEIVSKPETAVEACAVTVRGLLNKLTDSNRASTTDSIVRALRSSELAESDVVELCEVICNVGSGSAYYAGMYASICAAMSAEVPEMKAAIASKLNGFAGSLVEIVAVGEDDYDAFCKMNAAKDARKGAGLFLINLALSGVVPVDYVADVGEQLVVMLRENLDDSGAKRHMEDLLAMAIAFLGEVGVLSSAPLAGLDSLVKEVSDMSRKDHAGLTSKALFAAMDYVEELA